MWTLIVMLACYNLILYIYIVIRLCCAFQYLRVLLAVHSAHTICIYDLHMRSAQVIYTCDMHRQSAQTIWTDNIYRRYALTIFTDNLHRRFSQAICSSWPIYPFDILNRDCHSQIGQFKSHPSLLNHGWRQIHPSWTTLTNRGQREYVL